MAAAVALGIALFVIVYPPRSVAQSSGLVAAYSFNEGTGGTVADLSGNNLTGTIVGAAWTAGRYASGLSFNGTTSYVDLGNPAALQLTGSMTIEAWVNAAATPPDDGQIVAKSDGTGWQFKTSPDTGPNTFGVGVSGTSGAITQRYSTTVRSLNTWYHVAGVYNATAGTLSTYVNGVLDNGTLRGTIPATQVNQAVNVNIGRRTGGFYFNGTIDEVRIYNRALSATEIQTDMNTPLGGAPQPDTTPPTVSMSAPADGATVSGTVGVTAAVADNVGVAGVQYLLDNANLGTEGLTPPFTLQWNTTATAIGPHTLAAIARDFSGNTATSTNISVTVSNPSGAQVGQWSAVMTWPIVAVHAALLPTGSVLAWTDYTSNAGAQLWRPGSNTFVPKTYNPVSLFCSALSFLADGRLLAAGGIVGLQDDLGPYDTTIFNPVTETWSAGAFMAVGRYYPTTTTLGDGRVFVNGGTTTCVSCIADLPEILDPVSNTWTPLASTARKSFLYYPHNYVLPDGRLLVAAQDDRAIATSVLDLTTQQWTTVDSRIIDGHSSVMYLPGKILKSGTATADNPGHPSAPTSYTLDMTQASPAWQATGSMAFPRSFHNLTVLPDGHVLATGGGTTTDPADHSKAVYEAELWSPTTRTWITLSRSQIPRLYHSTALLLPDATVLVAGGGRQNGRSQPDPADEPNAEIFSPPYLFKGPRPVMTSAPSVIPYNGAFSVVTPDAARIGSVSLIALGAVTHAFNENQRFVPLAFAPATGSLNLQGPSNGNTAPPGPYMLFLVDTNGVPSVAAMVRLPGPGEDTQPPTPPGNLTAAASTGAATLNWSPSTDDVGVLLYNVHRSPTSGFTPTTANRIGQPSGTIYTDTSLPAAGTYYYLVTAQDGKGNVSTPSNEASAAVAFDTTRPTVSLTAPTAGSTVSGVISVTASATDDVAMAGVQFLLDGGALGLEVAGSGPTYSLSWATTTAVNGPHTLSARARDGATNTALAADVGVTVANTAPSALVAAYSFNEGTGTTLTDVSGNNLTGAIVGATWTTAGRYGNGLSFNGTSNYVDLGNPTALQLTGSMTIEAWVKAAANPADDGQIVAKSDGTGWQFKTSPDTGPHTFGVGVSGTTGPITQRYSTTVRALGTWYHVAGVYDATAGTLSTYVNGVLDNGTLRSPIPAAQVNQNVNVNIGRRTGGFYFNGVIDEVRIYDRALSAAEIQTDMNTPIDGAPPPPPPPPPPTDTTPPNVSLTVPTGGATLGGTVAVTASASDDVAVAAVQFLLDGANLGTEVTGAGPSYTYTWNTTGATNDTHMLSARARDAAGNTATAVNVGVTVSNTTAASLVAAYSLNEGSGTTAGDSSGNGITGTVSGATWTTAGWSGSALSFNGTTDYVDLGNPPALQTAMTWAAWVYATGAPPDDGSIIAKSDDISGWQFKTSPDTGPHTFAISVSGGAGFAQRYSNTVRALNTWYHVAGVYNAATLTLDIYVNGVLDNGVLRGTIPASLVGPSVNAYIGRRTNGFYFIGTIDEVRVYNSALSQTEVQALMNTPLP